jgi:hypothetical protein
VAQPGDAITTAQGATVIFQPAVVRDRVGLEGMEETASDGGVLVVVRYAVKNATQHPLKAYDLPTIHLVDDKGVSYAPDAGKTGMYALEEKLDLKVWSDLNPGISVKNAEVFEVSKDAFSPTKWQAAIDNTDQTVALM